MPQIRPIKDLRDTNEISELCHKQNEPVFITKNGYGDLVIMSMETYESQIALGEIYKRLNEAEKELSKGEEFLLDGEKVFERLNNKYVRKQV